jgi:3-oxoacyl-[acyl-carrier-protein] synthase II
MSRSGVLDRRPQVVVSGLGVVSPYGAGAKSFWTGLAAGTCAIRPITVIETEGFRSRIAAEIPAETVSGLGASRRRSRADRLALAAAREALADSGLEGPARAEAALLIGAVGGGMLEGERWYWRQWRGQGSRGMDALRSILPFSHAETLGWRLGLTGPKETVVMACASGGAAIALGADLIRAGVVRTALVGGVDALTHICFMGFNALKLLDPAPCRPFDRDRRGMSIGEAAAFLVIEDAEHCRARGGRAYARLAGYGMSTDAHHVTAPHPEG